MLSCEAVLSRKNAFYPIYDKIIIPTIVNCLRIMSIVALFYLKFEKCVTAIFIRFVFLCLNLYGFYQGLIEAKIMDQIKDKKWDRIILASTAILFEPLLPSIFLIVVRYYNKKEIISSQYIQIPNENEDNIDTETPRIELLVPSTDFIDESELFEIDSKNKLNNCIEWMNEKILMFNTDIDNEVFFWMVSCQFEFVAHLVFCCYYTSVDWKYGFIYLDKTLFVNDHILSLRILPLIYVIVAVLFSIKVLFYWIADMFRNCYHVQRMLLLLPTEYLLYVLTILFDIFSSFALYSFYAQHRFNSYWNYHYFPVYISHVMILYLLFYWLCLHGPFVLWYNRMDLIHHLKNHTLMFCLLSVLIILMTLLCAWLLYWILFAVWFSLFSFFLIMLANQYTMNINHSDHDSFRAMWTTFCNFILNSKSSKDELYRIMSLKSTLHSCGLVKNDELYNKFVHFTDNEWLVCDRKKTIKNIQSLSGEKLSNTQRLKEAVYPICNDMRNGIYSLQFDFGDVVFYGECALIVIFLILLFVIILSKMSILPYLLLEWMWNIQLFGVVDYILFCICCLLLITIIIFIYIIYKQRELINFVVLNDENWNGLIYDKNKDSKQINHFGSDIQERYEALITFKEIKFILECYFIDEIANIIWSYSCGQLTYKEKNDFEYLFTETSLPFVVQRSNTGLFVSHCSSNEFEDKSKCDSFIGSQIIAANNHNLQYYSFDEAHNFVTKKIRLPIVMIFRPPY